MGFHNLFFPNSALRSDGAAVIVPHNAMADRIAAEITNFIEQNTEAEIIDSVKEIR